VQSRSSMSLVSLWCFVFTGLLIATPTVAQSPDSPKQVINSIGMKLVLIPAGTFMMGSPTEEPRRFRDESEHQVTLAKRFYMGCTEVTQGQWKKVMDTEPWKGKDSVEEGDDFPAVHTVWDEAVEFCRKLSELETRVYRLPTEAEWEYACRGGTTTAFSFGADDAELGNYAWYNRNAWDVGEKFPHRVAQKRPNPFGLYDMHGNVREWCSDWYSRYPTRSLTDPSGPKAGTLRVLRGGTYRSEPRLVRSAARGYCNPQDPNCVFGFRLVLE
jgi:formylglycine-generating enzyme required for sulfatase activity